MHFTVGSSRVRLSLSRLSSNSSLPNRIDNVDLEKATDLVLPDPELGVYNIHSHSASSKDRGIWTVRKINDGEISSSRWKKTLFPYLGLTASLPVIAASWYTIAQLRIISKYREDQAIWDWKMFVGLFLVGIDLLSFFVPVVSVILIAAKSINPRHRPQLQLSGDNVPAVDVLVTSCNEDVEVIKDTLLAVLSIDYPQEKFRVIISDDGASKELKAWVSQLGHPNLHYTSRTTRGGFKAGNLNHAVALTERLPGSPSDFIAALDADMIVEKRWLRSVMAHIILDDRVAVVCPAQHFYNVPINDPLEQSNVISWHGQDLLRDNANWAWNSGSGYVLRRQALQEIGGFPTKGLTEDVQSSVNMMAKGWKTAYLPEELQWGLIPETYHAHLKQFVRWNVGGSQIGLHFDFYLNSSKTDQLTVSQRFLGFTIAFSTMIYPILVATNQICAPIRFVLGTPLAYFHTTGELRMLLRLQCAMFLLKWLQELHLSVFVGYRAAVQESCFATWMSPYFALSTIRSFFLPKWLGGTTPGFTSTGSISNTLHERSAHRRASLRDRLHDGLFECSMWFHAVLIAALAMSVAFRSRIVLQHFPIHDTWNTTNMIEILRQVAWPAPFWLKSIFANLTPLLYLISPPNVPERDKLLGNREKSGARYPLQEFRKVRSTWAVDNTLFHYILILYTAVVFLWTFTI
ncbi:glycosyltransferase family 2 protein [Periconia macrospinosa]|uniref:Glycosyltransferase family 2 protein n=1 Tax=Periconia macrospinosa TaxID=97972 RepID=A0A2V1DZC2_9PLEO|nr:glycosyltransferase family 2 protein [Periconia macrospinosa]